MKNYTITLQGKEINITQNDDGTFNKPDFILELEKQGTATKPAHEPICLARKPLSEKSVAENCLKWGTGGINIDESRVEANKEDMGDWDRFKGYQNNNTIRKNMVDNKTEDFKERVDNGVNNLGRFPANLIHDNSEEVRECFPDVGGGKYKAPNARVRNNGLGLGTTDNRNGLSNAPDSYGDSGNASRFFKSIIYQAKASKSERNKGCDGLDEKDKAGKDFRPNHAVKAELGEEGNPFGRWGKIKNNHPTVKPIALMEYLIKMITPKGGIVLDPFAGSGSTLVAARDNSFQYIGIEMTEEYLPIIQARVGCEIIKQELNIKNMGMSQDELRETERREVLSGERSIYDTPIQDKVDIKKNVCPKCGGKLVKTKYGLTCEDCMEDY